jgi:hypothetical protein
MRLTVSTLLARLRAEGLATTADADAVRATLAAGSADEMPAYLRAVVGFGAWLATAFLLACFMGLHLLDAHTTRVTFGVALVALAVWLHHRARGEFRRHASIAASFAGQGLIVVGLAEGIHLDGFAAMVAVLLSVAMIRLMPDRLHRFVSAIVAVCGVAVALRSNFVPAPLDVTTLFVVAVGACIWRARLDDRVAELDEMLIPVGYGLVVSLFGICAFGAFSAGVLGRGLGERLMFGTPSTIGIALALALLARDIVAEHGTQRQGAIVGGIVVAIALFAAATLQSPGIIAGVAVLVLGFDRRNSVLIELAVAFLLVFGAVYYYSLELTLLEKSGILVGSGALCLAARTLLGAPPVVPPASGT